MSNPDLPPEMENPGALAGATGANGKAEQLHREDSETGAKSNRLPTLADEARRAHGDAVGFAARAAERAIAAGAALVEAKALCAHGTWGAWLRATGIPERSAQRYMTLHRAGCTSAIVADLGIARAERVAALGLQLLPKDGRGIEATAVDDGCRAYAVTLPEAGGRVRYWCAYLWGGPEADFYVTRLCALPFALGLLHGGFERFDRCDVRSLTLEETASARVMAAGGAA